MKTLLLLFILGFSIGTSAYSQQLSGYSLLQENWILENPASYSIQYLLGARNHILAITGRYQWTELSAPPETIAAQYQSVIDELNIAIGGIVLKDQTGAIGNAGALGNFSYLIYLTRSRNKKAQFFSVGLNIGLQQYSVRLSQIDFAEPDYVSIPSENLSRLYPDVSFGLFYYIDNTFFAGVSVPQTFGLNTFKSEKNGIDFERIRHYYASAGGYIPLNRDKRKPSFVIPSAWVRFVENAPVNVNFNLRFSYGNHFFLGGGGNTSNNYRAETGFSIPFKLFNEGALIIGIAYEFNASSFSSELGNTFELNISHAWGNSRRVECPSWF